MADPGFANGGPRSSAACASIEAPKAPRGAGEKSVEWAVPPPPKFFLTLDLKMSIAVRAGMEWGRKQIFAGTGGDGCNFCFRAGL